MFRKLAVLFLSIGAALWCQTPSATVVGRVVDASGARVPGANIQVRNAATTEARRAQTGESGEFTVPSLTPGVYEVQVDANGFRTLRQGNIELQIDQTARLEFRLEVGSISDSVEVMAEAPLINTENSTKGDVISSKEMVELPLDGRDFQDLAFLVPGVYRRGENGQGSAMAINGARADNTGFLVDGFSSQNVGQGGAQSRPPIDAMQEFKMQTSGYSAEYGRLSGGVMNMAIKSGGNQPHGSVFEFLRNDLLDARTFFSADKPKLRRNQFGGMLNGPVYIPHLYNGRNRTFFLFSWESYRQINGVTKLTVVPTALERVGDFSNTRNAQGAVIPIKDPLATATYFQGNVIPTSRFSPVAVKLMAYYPMPNRVGANNYGLNANNSDSWDNFLTKIDQRFTEKDSISFRLMRRPEANFNPYGNNGNGSTLGTFGSTTASAQTMAALSYTRMFSPVLINEARLALMRTAQSTVMGDQGQDIGAALGIPGIPAPVSFRGFPWVTVTGLATLGDATSNANSTYNNWQYGDNLTWVKARHLMKFGADVIRAQDFQPYTTNERGNFAFLGKWTGAPLADMELGLLDSAQRTAGAVTTYFFNTMAGFFAQDDFKALPNLTLNIGLRYELMPPTSEKNGRLANFVPELGKLIVSSDKTIPNLAQQVAALGGNPGRVGLARDYGLPSSLVYANKRDFAPRFGMAWRPFGDNRTSVRGGYGIFYGGFADASIRTLMSNVFPFVSSQYYGRQASSPTTLTLSNPFPDAILQAGGTIQPNGFETHPGAQYLQSWNLTFERELGGGTALEIGYVGSKGTHLGRIYNLNAQEFLPNASGIAPIQFPGFSTTINYHAFVANSIYNAGVITLRRRIRGGTFFSINYTYGKSIDDASQIYGSSNGGYPGAENPQNLRAERGRSDWDVGHAIAMSFVWEVPLHGPAFVRGWQVAGTGRMYTGAPFTPRLSNVPSNESGRPDRIATGKVANPGPDGWFNLSAFPVAAPYHYGDSGRNILDGPGYVALNASLIKNFRLEPGTLEFRWEAFNATNHTDFNLPVTFVNQTNGGSITQAAAARTMQIGLRYQF